MKLALITGASRGIGEQFAYELAREHYALVLTARNDERLRAIADKAGSLGAPLTITLARDLAQRSSPKAIFDDIERRGLSIDLLINNAGFGTYGHFVNLPADRELSEIQVNVTALVSLTSLFLPSMIARRSGTIINIASSGAFQPIPYMATYTATKAFVLAFTQSLWGELRDTGVNVIAVCPGPTRTEFHALAGITRMTVPSSAWMLPDVVASRTLRVSGSTRSLYIPGLMNYATAQLARVLPRSFSARVGSRLFRPSAG